MRLPFHRGVDQLSLRPVLEREERAAVGIDQLEVDLVLGAEVHPGLVRRLAPHGTGELAHAHGVTHRAAPDRLDLLPDGGDLATRFSAHEHQPQPELRGRNAEVPFDEFAEVDGEARGDGHDGDTELLHQLDRPLGPRRGPDGDGRRTDRRVGLDDGNAADEHRQVGQAGGHVARGHRERGTNRISGERAVRQQFADEYGHAHGDGHSTVRRQHASADNHHNAVGGDGHGAGDVNVQPRRLRHILDMVADCGDGRVGRWRVRGHLDRDREEQRPLVLEVVVDGALGHARAGGAGRRSW